MRPSAQLRAFALAHTREALRDPRGFAALLTTFVGLVGLIVAAEALFVGDFDGTHPLLRRSLPVIAITGFSSLALISTAVPLVASRDAGVLRQLGTTPARRAPFLLGHVPVRLGIGLVQIGVMLAIALPAAGPGALPAIAALLSVGLVMLLALGYLLGSVLRDPDRAMQLGYAVPFVILATSGALFPFEALPGPFAAALDATLGYLPTSLLASALASELGGTTGSARSAGAPSLAWVIAALLGTALLLAAAAAQRFRWIEPGND